jgi:hypothetical protein
VIFLKWTVRLFAALGRRKIWQQVLLAYVVTVGVAWLAWGWQIPERRTSSRAWFAFLIVPLVVVVGTTVARALVGDRDE